MNMSSFAIFTLCFHFLGASPLLGKYAYDISKIDVKNDLLDDENSVSIETWRENSPVNPEELGNYFEGDILIPGELIRNGLTDKATRWENAVVPYEIVGSFGNSDLETIQRAMGVYHKYTCIRFVPRKSTDKDYISLTNAKNGCWSSVGKITGKQDVNLQNPACTTKLGTVLHELMHACGFYHEQNRPERDDYVTINFENIKTGHDANFIKADRNKVEGFNVPYDYKSVMHYSNHAFSKNGKPTIVAKNSEGAGKMGQRDGFSRGDILKLNAMYGCPNDLPEYINNKPENTNGVHGGQDLLSSFLNLIDI